MNISFGSANFLRRIQITLAVLTTATLVLSAMPAAAFATINTHHFHHENENNHWHFNEHNHHWEYQDNDEHDGDNENDKITICHATGEEGHYQTLEVSVWGIIGHHDEDDDSESDNNGHDGHENDIIPSFTYNAHHDEDDDDSSATYEGKNFDQEGQDILDNDCQIPMGTIVVNKVVEGSGTEQSFSFNPSWDEEGFSLANGEENESELHAGEYSISEDVAEGWNEPEVSCVSSNEGDEETADAINLSANETVTCTFTNTPVVEEPQQCENLLTNGSFEDPALESDGWSIVSTVTGWVRSLSDGVEIWRNFNGSGAGLASDGVQNIEMDGNDATKISQAVTTIPGATYKLTFDFSPRAGTNLAENNIDVAADATVILNASADGSTNNTNVWAAKEATFVATDASTDISFEDKGIADDGGGLGGLIDNARLCLIKKPEPAKVCSVNVVSDTTNTVTEKAGANAVLTWVHPAWIASITDSAAKWIWGTTEVENPGVNETETFVKKFNWNGPATAAVLKLATDNSYTVKLNGNDVGADATEDNYSSIDSIDVVSEVQTGENTLEIAVTNKGVGDSVPHDNPAGLLYDLTVTGNDTVDCTATQTGDDDSSDQDTYQIFGYVWNDENENDSKDSGESNLSGWIVKATNTETQEVITDETDADGKYELNVPAGTWVISQETEDGWHQLSLGDGDGTYTVTVPELMTVAFPLNLFFTVAEAATLGTVGPKNFGNEYVGFHGGSSSSHHHKSSTPDGEVLGASTSNLPQGQVLGAATSTMPVGAPNTGAGGTSPVVVNLPTLSAILTTTTRRKAQ